MNQKHSRMKHTNTSEKEFQNQIINHLISTGYHKRVNENYNKATCLDPELTLKFTGGGGG